MYSQKPKKVTIASDRGKLRLLFPRQWGGGKQIKLSLGLDDTPEGRYKADLVAKEIELDYAKGQLKPLHEYKPNQNQPVIQPISSSASKASSISMVDLWEKYTAYRTPQVEETTLKLNYARVASHIAKNPYQLLTEASDMILHLVSNNSPYTAKRVIAHLNACCNWAKDEIKYIDSNPFAGVAAKIRQPKTRKRLANSDPDFESIDPFTTAEIREILTAFDLHPRYNHYTKFVKFLFLTGCRTSEAVGLKWGHINKDCSLITFKEAIVCASGKLICKSLKTQHSRKFPCNRQLQEFLLNIKPETATDNVPVFTSLQGKIIRADVFHAFCWKGCENKGKTYPGIVQNLADAGKIERYRPQYQTRHSYITLMLNNGVEIKDIAKLVGNSAEVIYKHYAGVRIESLQMPEIEI